MNELLIVAGIGLLLILVLLVPTITTSNRRRRAAIDKQFVNDKWQKVTILAERQDESVRYAVIEADKLLDYTLKQRGYPGETMGERLKAASDDLSFKNDVWEAHKLRNKLVHEAEYEIDQRLVKRAIEQFRQGLKDMGAM